MPSRSQVVATCAATALALLAASAPATAAQKRITGKLSKGGYTVIAIAATGEAKSVRATPRFKLRPPAKVVTLHLRGRDGTYAGPVVIDRRKRGRRAVVGVKRGARLGKIRVKPRRGYARLRRDLPNRFVGAKLNARARNGAPSGAGNFGRVRSKLPRKPPPGDRDRDGIPDALDIDDDGDLVLDDVDTDPKRGANAIAAQDGRSFNAFTALFLGSGVGGTATTIVNANAPGLSDEEIESGLRSVGTLQTGGLTQNTGSPFDSVELDCAGDPTATPPRPGLVYCSAGGTGKRDAGGNPGVLDPNPEPFPACCDPDGDGFGSLGPGPWPGHGILLQTGADADQIRAGDLLLVRAEADGEQHELTSTLATVFVTVPAIAFYVDERGTRHDVSYPVAPGTAFPAVDGPDPDSDISVDITFWRPQRRAIPGEPSGAGDWIDIGRLPHYAHVPGAGPCPESSYSAVDEELTPSPGFRGFPGLELFLLMDSVDDQPADPGNTFSYTLNLSQCNFRSNYSFDPGEAVGFHFAATLVPEAGQPVNSAESSYFFRHEP